jgi:hypothetical protein
MIPYKGYLISGEAVRIHPDAPDWWRTQGAVFTNKPKESIQIRHLDGVSFESQKLAETYALDLCKKWVDENLEASDDV